MNNSMDVKTLDEIAAEEILVNTKRVQGLANEFGATAWLPKPSSKTVNKRFLNNIVTNSSQINKRQKSSCKKLSTDQNSKKNHSCSLKGSNSEIVSQSNENHLISKIRNTSDHSDCSPVRPDHPEHCYGSSNDKFLNKSGSINGHLDSFQKQKRKSKERKIHSKPKS